MRTFAAPDLGADEECKLMKHDKTLKHMYPVEDDFRCIALKLRDPRQLFNSFDPAPFHERELDSAAAEYLLDAVRELADEENVKILLHFPDELADDTRHDIVKAVHHYFLYRVIKLRHQRNQLLRTGRWALTVGLVFMVTCSMLAAGIEGLEQIGWRVLREGLIILGWVAMWKPIDLFLYQWWPLIIEEKHCGRLQHMAIDIRQRESHVPASSRNVGAG
jgi:hypothetical protein